MHQLHQRSGNASETTVTLPNIRDIFPELSDTRQRLDNSRYPGGKMADAAMHGYNQAGVRSAELGCSASRDVGKHVQPPASSDAPVLECMSHLNMQRPFSGPHRQPRPRGHHHSRSLPQPLTAPRAHRMQSASCSPALCSDPGTPVTRDATPGTSVFGVHLEDTFSAKEHGNFSPEIGSAPVFRVNMTPSVAALQDSRSETGARANQGGDHRTDGLVGGAFEALNASFSLSAGASAPASFKKTSSLRRQYLKKYESTLSVVSLDGDKGKKHECPHCAKRFNRPSSLKIHVNTHTGLKPFECPFPRCGRQFNVNSNMRRHYRNHIRAGGSPVDASQRRTHSVFTDASPEPAAQRHTDWAKHTTRELHDHWESLDTGEASEEEEMDELEEDEGLDHPDDDTATSTTSATSSPSPASLLRGPFFRRVGGYSDVTSRSPLSVSSILSPSQSPPSSSWSGQHPTYMPSSSTFARSCKDASVSTTLRPAFASPTSMVRVKREAD